ncbi:OLC1v1037928C1 [Oldenlandia corymbosa var. corymbosa]|uniref:OLC1v1037928C1 n=1 Tax=Oldenlandia corymbosa var. corymbosa TaxID=529605 RepID=A0AAV1D025_OLDCO|nr:OLC1v1037928C1 [Oldenlandia corymbosa var. corymbosa]
MAAVRLLSFALILSLVPLFSMSVSDDIALLQFKESLTNTEALDPTWVKDTLPCDKNKPWIGVICNANTVQGIRLQGLRLSGDVDVDSLLELENLRAVLIANNNFSGTIPPFNKLGALKSLFIHGNQFTGEIPPDYFKQMASLKKIWLSENKFTGKIPDSLGQLQNLIEVRLDHNQFSGPVPLMDQKSLRDINLAFNKLEGPIPESMSRFGAKAFEGNQEVCGNAVEKPCNQQEGATPVAETPPETPANDSGSSSVKWVIMGLVVALLLMTLLCKARQKEEHFNLLGKENLDEGIQVHIPSSVRRSASSRRGNESFSSRRGSHHGGKSNTDLVVVNDEKGTFGLQDLMKAAAEVLGNGGLGSAYKAHMGNGVSVVVKRFREMNKLSKDSFDAEVRRLGKLKHPNILPPLAYHYRKDEKLLVSEFVPRGSLLYLLHGDRGTSHAELNWPTRLRIIQGVARGMGFIHSEFASYEVPHGNLKSSNILLSSDFEPLLTDYAFYPLISNTQSVQSLFAYKSPEAILYQQLSHKSDVYCLGIIILEILTGKFPSQYLSNQKGGTDLVQWVKSAIAEERETELIDPEIASDATNSLAQMEMLLHTGAACTEEYDKRIGMKEALRRIEQL